MNRPVVIAAVLTAVIVGLVQQIALVVAPVSMTVAAVVAGAVLGVLLRPREVGDVVAPAAVVGVVGLLTAALLMAVNGTNVLEPRFLLSWVVVAVLGFVFSSGTALLLGKFMPQQHA